MPYTLSLFLLNNASAWNIRLGSNPSSDCPAKDNQV